VSGAFDGLAALVTGASSGIGRATALALADAGASVVAVARRAERLDGVVAEIEAAGGSAVAAVADVSDEDAAATAVTRAVEMFGGLDVVVANAGAMLLGPVDGANTALWRRMIEANVYGALYTARSAVPHLIRAAAGPRGVGDLVLVSSTAGRVSREGQRRLRPHQARPQRVRGVLTPGTGSEAGPRDPRRARLGDDGVARPQRRGDAREKSGTRHRRRAAGTVGHRGRDRLRDHPPPARVGERDPRPAYRTGQLTSPVRRPGARADVPGRTGLYPSLLKDRKSFQP